MIEYNPEATSVPIFETDAFNNAFDDMFKEGSPNSGPLNYILDRHATVAAKGGKGKFNPANEYRDTTYFMHVLNASLIGGRALERYLIEKKIDIDDKISPLIRTFFAGCVLHDLNKLFPEDSHLDLAQVVSNRTQEIIKMIAGYVPDYERRLGYVKWLILATENGSRGAVSTSLDPEESKIRKIAKFVTFGDGISSILTENVPSHVILGKVRKRCELDNFNGFTGMSMIGLNDSPQTMLRNVVLRSLELAMNESGSGRRVLAVSPSMVIYFNEGVDLEDVFRRASQKVSDFLSGKKLYNAHSPSGKNFDPSFLSWTTDAELESYLLEYAEKFFMLEKVENLLESQPDFIASWNSRGYRIEKLDGNGRRSTGVKLTMKPCMQDAEGEDMAYNNLLFLFALKRILLTKGMADGPPKGSVTDKTIEALEFAWKNVNECDKIYPEIKHYVLDRARKAFPDKAERDGRKILDHFVSEPSITRKAMSKKDSCLICGDEGTIGFSDVFAFGFNATAGTGRKISEGKYNKGYKICGMCATEMELRTREFNQSEKESSVAVHLSIGDYVHPLNFRNVRDMMGTVLTKLDPAMQAGAPLDKESFLEKVSMGFQKEKGEVVKVPAGYHYLTFLPLKVGKRSEKYIQFTYIEELLRFVKATGFKVRVSSLTSSVGPMEQMFLIESAPSWSYPLKLGDVHIDEIDERLKDIDDMERVIGIKGRGKEREGTVLRVVMGLSRSYLSIYRIAREFMLDRRIWNSKVIEEYYPVVHDYAQRNAKSENMEIEELVKPALEIKLSPPKSSYDDERLIRAAFETVDRHGEESEADAVTFVCGNIASMLKTQFGGLGREGEEAIDRFAKAFVRFYFEKKSSMSSLYKKDIINAFAWVYHKGMWDRVVRNKTVVKDVSMDQARGEQIVQ